MADGILRGLSPFAGLTLNLSHQPTKAEFWRERSIATCWISGFPGVFVIIYFPDRTFPDRTSNERQRKCERLKTLRFALLPKYHTRCVDGPRKLVISVFVMYRLT